MTPTSIELLKAALSALASMGGVWIAARFIMARFDKMEGRLDALQQTVNTGTRDSAKENATLMGDIKRLDQRIDGLSERIDKLPHPWGDPNKR